MSVLANGAKVGSRLGLHVVLVVIILQENGKGRNVHNQVVSMTHLCVLQKKPTNVDFLFRMIMTFFLNIGRNRWHFSVVFKTYIA